RRVAAREAPPSPPPRARGWPFVVGGAIAIAASGTYAIVTPAGGSTCALRDPPDLTGAAPEVAAILGRELGRWRTAREAVCRDPQPAQLACLDAVLDHIATVRSVEPATTDAMFDWLVDPARCATDRPPRIATGVFPE